MTQSANSAHQGPDQVLSVADFLAYAKTLHAQLQAGAPGWENVTLPDFLKSLIAWAEDAPVSPEPTWRAMAELLRAGAFYE